MRKIKETETLKATPLTIVTGIALERSKSPLWFPKRYAQLKGREEGVINKKGSCL